MNKALRQEVSTAICRALPPAFGHFLLAQGAAPGPTAAPAAAPRAGPREGGAVPPAVRPAAVECEVDIRISGTGSAALDVDMRMDKGGGGTFGKGEASPAQREAQREAQRLLGLSAEQAAIWVAAARRVRHADPRKCPLKKPHSLSSFVDYEEWLSQPRSGGALPERPEALQAQLDALWQTLLDKQARAAPLCRQSTDGAVKVIAPAAVVDGSMGHHAAVDFQALRQKLQHVLRRPLHVEVSVRKLLLRGTVEPCVGLAEEIMLERLRRAKSYHAEASEKQMLEVAISGRHLNRLDGAALPPRSASLTKLQAKEQQKKNKKAHVRSLQKMQAKGTSLQTLAVQERAVVRGAEMVRHSLRFIKEQLITSFRTDLCLHTRGRSARPTSLQLRGATLRIPQAFALPIVNFFFCLTDETRGAGKMAHFVRLVQCNI